MDRPEGKFAERAGWIFWTFYLLLLILGLSATLALSPLKPSYDGRHLLHIAAGTVFLTMAPFQFIGAVRRRYPTYHRMAGRMLVAAALLAIASTFAINLTPLGTAALPSQTTLLLVWLGSLLAAIWCIRHGDVVWHQRHMARALVAGAYFLLIRLFDRLIGADRALAFEAEPAVRFANSDWLGWLVPMILVEIFMVMTTGGRGRPRPGL